MTGIDLYGERRLAIRLESRVEAVEADVLSLLGDVRRGGKRLSVLKADLKRMARLKLHRDTLIPIRDLDKRR